MNTQAYYPRFIRVMPKFFGLDLIDLGLFTCGLFLGRYFVRYPFLGLGIALVGILLNKTVLKGFDYKGLLLGRFKRSVLSLSERAGGSK